MAIKKAEDQPVSGLIKTDISSPDWQLSRQQRPIRWLQRETLDAFGPSWSQCYLFIIIFLILAQDLWQRWKSWLFSLTELTILVPFSLVQLSLNALGTTRHWIMSSRLKLMAVDDLFSVSTLSDGKNTTCQHCAKTWRPAGLLPALGAVASVSKYLDFILFPRFLWFCPPPLRWGQFISISKFTVKTLPKRERQTGVGMLHFYHQWCCHNGLGFWFYWQKEPPALQFHWSGISPRKYFYLKIFDHFIIWLSLGFIN